MIWLLDTNVISELRKPRPDKSVLNWIAKQDASSIWTSRVCLVEIQSGIALQVDPQQKQRLQDWHENSVLSMFDRKVFDVTEDALKHWIHNLQVAKARQQSAPPVDFLIAAICQATNSVIATRDVAPFVACGIPTLNPWTGERFNGA
jgi:toxin FitB